MISLSNLIVNADLDDDNKQDALNNVARATADELYILEDIFGSAAAWPWAGEIFSGAHLRVHDGAARYNDWRTLRSADTRHSSHRSTGPQFHIDGPLTHTVLFGWVNDWTWFQLERHTSDEAGHYYDWWVYGQSKENQGPYGTSPYTEERPADFVQTQAYVARRHP
jgi:hypothetical protein